MTKSTTPPNSRAQRIAQLNDEFRLRLRTDHTRGRPKVPGACFVTRGIDSLPAATQIAIQLLVREYTRFTPNSDPHGEHDFGSIDMVEVGKVFWKIDYCRNANLEDADDTDPADPTKSYRLLTIMLATDY